MDELPPHWHDLDSCGYVMEGRSYVINEENEKIKAKNLYDLII